MRLRALTLLLAVLTALVVALPAGASASARQTMLHAINAARAANGAPPVRRYRPLMRSSRSYARYMVAHDRWAHAANPARGANVSEVGEILGMTTTPNPAAQLIVNDWLQSPVHRPILLDPHFRYVGIGLRRGMMEGQLSWVWVVRFGRR
jgi:uncharacterized protein YkwD